MVVYDITVPPLSKKNSDYTQLIQHRHYHLINKAAGPGQPDLPLVDKKT